MESGETIFLVYKNFKKNETKLIDENEAGKLATINSGIDDLKNRPEALNLLTIYSSITDSTLEKTLKMDKIWPLCVTGIGPTKYCKSLEMLSSLPHTIFSPIRTL